MKKRFTEEQIIGILQEAERGAKVMEVCRKHGISDAKYGLLRLAGAETGCSMNTNPEQFYTYKSLFSVRRTQTSSPRPAHYINGLEGFWSWAKERLMKHHGISKKYFPLYIKELEFRYNKRNADLFDHIANYLCDLVPKWD